MSSIVLELQKEVSSPNCDIVSVLRRSHLIASKLKLSEFDQWISNELNGYPSQNLVPDYRIVKGAIKAFNPYRGWIPVIIVDPEFEKMLSEQRIPNSISELISLCEKSDQGIIMQYSGAVQQMINHSCDSVVDMQNALHISTSSVLAIIEKVKNAVLEWTIKLESEGVLGENLVFSEEERRSAQSMPQTINNYYGPASVVNGDINQSAVVSGNNNAIEFTYEKATEAVSAIEEALKKETISEEDKETALEMLAEIRDKIVQKKKPAIIKSALLALKDFIINAGGSFVGGVLQAKFMGMF